MGLLKEAGQAKIEQTQAKHMNLHSAIHDMDDIEALIEDLLHEINPRPSEISDETKNTQLPTLAEILNNGPVRIRASCDRMSTLIGKLREELF